MKPSEVRNWLGVYFLALTVATGGYMLIFADTWLLPIDKETAYSAFQIIIPVLVGQLTVVFRWFGSTQNLDEGSTVPLPVWVVKAPPLLVLVVMVTIIGAVIVGRHTDKAWPTDETFKAVITFCVSILNATTIFVVSRYFETPRAE